MAEEATEETPEEKAARQMMEKSFANMVQSSMDQFTPGMSAYDRMLADQGFGIHGPPVDYNMPGGAKGTRYSLLAGQPYANYNQGFLSTSGGTTNPIIPNIPSDAGVITTDTPAEERIPNYPRVPIIDGMPLNHTQQEIFDMFGNVLTDREFRGDRDSSGSSIYSRDDNTDGGLGRLWKNIRNPDVNMRGQPMDPAYKDFNVRDRMFDNPQGENLLGNLVTALTPFSAVPGLNDMVSKAIGGGVGGIMALGEKIPIIGDAIFAPLSKGMDWLGGKINPALGGGSSSIPSMIKNLVEYSSDAVAPNRPGYIMRKVGEDGERTHGLRTLLNRMADTVAEDRPNIFMREYDEETGKLVGDNLRKRILGLPRKGIEALRERMPWNTRAAVEKALGYDFDKYVIEDPSSMVFDPNASSPMATLQRQLDEQSRRETQEGWDKTTENVNEILRQKKDRERLERREGFNRLDYYRDDPSGLNRGLMGEISPDPFRGGKFPGGNKRFGGLTPAFNSMTFDLIDNAVNKAQNPFLLALQEATKRGMTVPEYSEFLQEQARKEKASKENMADGGIMYLADGDMVNEYPRKNGQISGPGTERSDDIPAMLSDGEFVTNAAALRGIGQMVGAPANNRAEQRRLGAREMYKLQRQGMKAAGVG